MTKPLIVKCPICRNESIWSVDLQYRPFCSQRCKLIDLGVWASEEYIVVDNQDYSPTAIIES